jgi:hypothetical protein
VDQPNVPILYTTPGKLDMIYGKLNGFLENIVLESSQKKVLSQSKDFLENKEKVLDVNGWKSLVGKF